MTSEPSKPAASAPASVDRRTALTRLWQLAASALGLGALAGCPGGRRAGQPGAAAAAQFDRHVVALREVPLNVAKELEINGRPAYLIHSKSAGEELWIALDRRCTHAGCKLYWDTNGEQLVCPCHGSKFDALGLPISGPAKRALKTYPVQVANGIAIIETGKPTPSP